MQTKCLTALLILFFAGSLSAQKLDSLMMRRIFDQALERGHCYENLRELCKDIGPRLTGSEGAAKAEQWGKLKMEEYGLQNVYLQSFKAPYWVRGKAEKCTVVSSGENLNVTALGGSVGTKGKLTAEVIEIKGTEHLESIGREKIEGKIVFINKPMSAKFIDTFSAYGACAGERYSGATACSKYGAVGVIVRSMTLRASDLPHTGVMGYEDGVIEIPAAAISTNDAHKLSNLIALNPGLKLSLEMSCENLGETTTHNVIGEIRGRKHPEKVIVIGGHLDSWDLGEGAHDDGAGVVQALEVLRIFKEMEYEPNYTIRCVMFMNEENGAKGGETYADAVKAKNEFHVAALESDRGGFSPRGFTFSARADQIEFMKKWKKLFEPYLVHIFEAGYGGVDINFLRNEKTALIGFVPDSQRYFDVHHNANDVFETVNKRELELGSASITSLIYLIDKYGMPEELKP
jgi:carboxypeptidase Q